MVFLLKYSGLTQDDLTYLKSTAYRGFEEDMRSALAFFNPNTPFLSEEFKRTVLNFPIHVVSNQEHKFITDFICKNIKGNQEGIGQQVLQAAHLRKFLG